MDWLNSLDEGTQKIIVTIGLVAAAVGPVLIVVGKVMSAVGTIMTVIPKLASAFGVVSKAVAAFNAVLAANPIILIVAAVAAVIAALVLLYTKCEWFRDGVNFQLIGKCLFAWQDMLPVQIAVHKHNGGLFPADFIDKGGNFGKPCLLCSMQSAVSADHFVSVCSL